MAWCCQATSHYLSQCWPRHVSPYGVTKPQWVKEDKNKPDWSGAVSQHVISRQAIGLNGIAKKMIWFINWNFKPMIDPGMRNWFLTLAMTCCLGAANHCLNQYWLVVNFSEILIEMWNFSFKKTSWKHRVIVLKPEYVPVSWCLVAVSLWCLPPCNAVCPFCVLVSCCSVPIMPAAM